MSPKMIFILVVRFLAFAATLSAAIVMGTSREDIIYLTNTVEVNSSDSAAFKYFVIANGIGCAYSFLVLFLPSESLLWRLIVALDGVLAMLLTSSTSAAMAASYLERTGYSTIGWQPICRQFPNYCDHITGALIAGFVGLGLYILLLLYAIHIVLNPLLVHRV